MHTSHDFLMKTFCNVGCPENKSGSNDSMFNFGLMPFSSDLILTVLYSNVTKHEFTRE